MTLEQETTDFTRKQSSAAGETMLFALFLTSFLLSLLKSLWNGLLAIQAGKASVFIPALSDWLINYEAGFVRRGLVGSALIRMMRSTGLTPAISVMILCSLSFALVVLIAFRAAADFPKWALLSTPLLAFRLNTDIYLFKDSLSLLLFALCLQLLRAPTKTSRNLGLWSLIGVVGTLSHEVFFLITVPLSWLLMWQQDRQLRGAPQRRRFFDGSLRHSFLLLAPVVALIAIYLHRGTTPQALAIENSWRQAAGAAPVAKLTEWTQIWWLGFDTDDGFRATLNSLATAHHGIPYWLYAVTMLLLAIAAINGLWKQKQERTLFPWLCALQLMALSPVILGALDTGRWVHLIVFTSFLATCLYRQSAADMIPAQWAKIPRRIRLPLLITPAILFLWGMPIGQTVNSYMYSSLGNLLARLNEAYILARLAGLPHPASLLP